LMVGAVPPVHVTTMYSTARMEGLPGLGLHSEVNLVVVGVLLHLLLKNKLWPGWLINILKREGAAVEKISHNPHLVLPAGTNLAAAVTSMMTTMCHGARQRKHVRRSIKLTLLL